MALIESMLMECEQEAQTTRKLLERVPEDKLAWKPHPKSFTLGQLALHLAQGPGRVAMMSTLNEFELPDFQQAQPASRAEIVEALTQAMATVREVLSGMSDSKLTESWTLRKNGTVLMTMPRAALLRSIMLNHSYHHRGQLSVYLRLLDVPIPSIYGPSADENPSVGMKAA